jgi:hypothetical protein
MKLLWIIYVDQITLEQLCPFKFYSRYEPMHLTKTTESQDEHPSYNQIDHLCHQCFKKKREGFNWILAIFISRCSYSSKLNIGSLDRNY